MAFLKKSRVADFFLNEENPYSKKRTIKMIHVVGVLGFLALGVLILGSVFEKRDNELRVAAEVAKETKASTSTPAGAATAQNSGYVSLPTKFGSMGGPSSGSGRRQASASQIIQRGESSADTLPIGTRILVQLIGNVESTDANSPVQAVLLEDALSPAQSIVIPKGTTVIGSGQLDANRERLQVRFHTFVFPEGQQFTVSGLATMPDGSSGLEGDFSSGQFKRNVSQFLGNFVGGLAKGMTDKTSNGQLGIPVEPGSLKNGVLNGVAQSSMNYAKASSEQMGQVGASIRVKSGARFQVYLEREFHP